jgi:hypothetical protein
MALFVILKSKRMLDNKPNEFERHIPFDRSTLPALINEEIDSIQADGDELDEIYEFFPYLDEHRMGNRVVTWSGEVASLIYFNLRK